MKDNLVKVVLFVGMVIIGIYALVMLFDTNNCSEKENLEEAYSCAVKDAEIAESEEIVYDLIPITMKNNYLTWNDSGNVLMISWTSWDGYDESVGQSVELGREVWVTAVPELQDFCSRYDPNDAQEITLRLEQVLGLPPDNGKTKFVEMWVNPQDMFRPSPDPEITDQSAELEFRKNVDKEHKIWIEKLATESYGKDGYPWTRLGYTYDWGNLESEVGISEFVIKGGSDVIINSVIDTLDYCEKTH